VTLPDWIVFVESNTSGTGRLFAASARALGYQPVLLTREPARYPYVAADDVPFRVIDTSASAALRDAADRLRRERPIAAVLSSSEYFLASSAELARACGVPGPDPAAVRRTRDKAAQRAAFRAAGLNVPASRRVRSARQARRAAQAIGMPVILKPVDGTGSIGVRLCTHLDEVEAHAGTLLARGRDERGRPVEGSLLVEEYIAGREYSAEMFGRTLIGITRKHLSDPPFFVELGHDYPVRLPRRTEAAVARVVRAALRALGLGWGPAHVEFRMTRNGPVIIEVNARLAGGFIPELVRAAQNVDLITQTIRLATGQAPRLHPTRAERAAIRFVTSGREGRIAAVLGRARATRMPGVVDVQTYRAAGDRLERHHDFRDRIGHAIARAKTAPAAADAASRACDRLRVRLSRAGA
jgi:biotin carboxylase